jgi:hypothetical protein
MDAPFMPKTLFSRLIFASDTAEDQAIFLEHIVSDDPQVGTGPGPYSQLDRFLDTADRVCACVLFVAYRGVLPGAISHPHGVMFDKEVRSLAASVSLIDTTVARVRPKKWAAMTTRLADILAAGLRLTEVFQTEAWRVEYLSAVSEVRVTRNSLSPVGPYTRSADSPWWRFREQLEFFGIPDPREDWVRHRYPALTSALPGSVSPPPKLTPSAWGVVRQLQAAGATSEAKKISLDDLAVTLDAAEGLPRGTRTAEHLKRHSGKLSKLGYTASSRGRGSGIWLTASGHALCPPPARSPG